MHEICTKLTTAGDGTCMEATDRGRTWLAKWHNTTPSVNADARSFGNAIFNRLSIAPRSCSINSVSSFCRSNSRRIVKLSFSAGVSRFQGTLLKNIQKNTQRMVKNWLRPPWNLLEPLKKSFLSVPWTFPWCNFGISIRFWCRWVQRYRPIATIHCMFDGCARFGIHRKLFRYSRWQFRANHRDIAIGWASDRFNRRIVSWWLDFLYGFIRRFQCYWMISTIRTNNTRFGWMLW